MTSIVDAGPRADGRRDGPFRRNPALTDLIVAAVYAIPLGLVSLRLLQLSDSPLGWRVLAGVAVVVLHVATALRRRWPRVAFGIGAGMALVLSLLPPLQDAAGNAFPAFALPSILVFGVLVFTAARVLDARASWACLAVALAVAAVVVVRLWNPEVWGRPSDDGELILWRAALTLGITATILCLWALGRLARVRDAHVAELREKAERADADRAREQAEAARAERDRISRELHDIVSHSLAVMVSQAEGGRLSDPAAPTAATFATISSIGRESLRDMRGLLGVLRSDAGTARVPQPGLADLPSLVSQVRAAGVQLVDEASGNQRRLRPAADLAAFRVVQEALTNVLKHAGPAPAAGLSLDWTDDRLVIRVHDSGAGPHVDGDPGGAGLEGMRERLQIIGGSLETNGRAGEGFTLTATIPYDDGSLP
ncbi:sensor histidine kinase [Agromyces cerinus]|uniref:histidine kinase n=1 Tax=Agromyces cerinus subsp. cerinus TaxID=232089 RepID=A0A1N6F2B6_9MICO|nr:histidine kinase [Agromyces cerinus]SIN89404.1 Signal transduction histidine kinase [Agromyces cerinus subsp. cerinus]